jgi:hypothetical protein
MRTSWMLPRSVPPAARDRDRRVGASVLGRRAARAGVLAGLVLGLVLGLSGCGAGDGDESATRPDPSVTATAPTRPTRTSTSTPTPTRTPTSAERPTSPTTRPATSAEALTPTSTPAAAGTPAAAESQGLGTLGWTLLIVLVAGLIIAGWLLWRSRSKSAWDAQAAALEHDTRTTTATQLPSVLTAETAGQRALSWPPLRAALSDLMRRWELLAERAPDDQRRTRSGQVRSLLLELVAAVDAENQALAAGRDWRLLQPQVDQAGRALSTVLAGVAQPEPAVGGEPWQPAPGG